MNRPIILRPASQRPIVIRQLTSSAPSIRLLAGPPGEMPGPPGSTFNADSIADGLKIVGEEIRIDIDSLNRAD